MVLLLFLVLLRCLVVIKMVNEKDKIYKDIIMTLSYIELVVTDKKQFAVIRKNLLDIANNVKRIGE